MDSRQVHLHGIMCPLTAPPYETMLGRNGVRVVQGLAKTPPPCKHSRPVSQGRAVRMQGPWTPISKLSERGAANESGEELRRMDRGGKDTRVPLGRLPILTMRIG
eukprot:8009294-Pyramimonas_sp.AAC.1